MYRKCTRRLFCLMTALLLLGNLAFAETGFENENLESPESVVTAALEVYSWFAMCPLDVDPEQPDEQGVMFRVYDDRLNTREKLETVVRDYFSEEIANALLASGVYSEEGGYLYTGETYRDIDPTIALVEYAVAEQTEDKVWYTATVYYSETEGEITSIDEYTFLRENIDGKWLFTDFWFFW